MTYIEALRACADYTELHQCTAHVQALITGSHDDGQPPTIDPKGYTVTDWYDGAIVATFTNGKRDANPF